MPPLLLQPAEGRKENKGTCCAEVAVALFSAKVGVALQAVQGGCGWASFSGHKGTLGSMCYGEAASQLPWRCLQ